jgi:hypothetical protein
MIQKIIAVLMPTHILKEYYYMPFMDLHCVKTWNISTGKIVEISFPDGWLDILPEAIIRDKIVHFLYTREQEQSE